MDGSSPRVWPYAANNSPLPLPNGPVLFTPSAVVDLVYEGSEDYKELQGCAGQLTGSARMGNQLKNC